MRAKHLAALGLALGIGFPGAAFAQEIQLEYEGNFDPEQFQASADPGAIALTDGARTFDKGSFAVGMWLNLAGPPLDICVSDATSTEECQIEGNIVGTRFRGDLTFLYGLGKIDVRAILPMVLYQSTDFDPAMGEEGLGSAGFGDLRLGGRYQLAKPGDAAIAADLSFTLPTGTGDFIGDAGWIADPRILADWRKNQIALGAALGYRLRTSDARVANLYLNDEITWSLGGQYEIQPDKLSAGLALHGRLGIMSTDTSMEGIPGDLGSEEFPAEILASGRYWLSDKLALDFGAGTAMTAGYGAPPYRVLVGIQWINRVEQPLIKDSDRDGITDDDDKCVNDPEDVDDFEDMDGCPEVDNDADGISDKADSCPNVAEDMDQFEDTDGCPDGDNDGDGVADGMDACPMDPEDKDGYIDDDGCPELDADSDGIADVDDACPMEAETMNGEKDDDGCPDERPKVVVTSTAIEITDMIFFDLNKARIKSRSYPILDAVADVLKAHADLNVEVQGHTDSQGDEDKNLTLSQKRAEAVRDYLISKGIDAARLTAKGYGESVPEVEGDDEAAWSKNRRVEFVIINTETGDTSGAGEPIP
jgi:outer membrane protein OmpA-like peptidoglycan-associated protein